ncbi:MAG: hypothetical protein KAG14_03730, partial [Mycoplasmataceae bacterium]|nr:hypothetical protein [Mycoplasmataceae bacterium]
EANNYIDGELPLRKRIGLFIHLVMCKCCRNYLQQIRNTISTISIMQPKEKNSVDTQDLAKQLHKLCNKEHS